MRRPVAPWLRRARPPLAMLSAEVVALLVEDARRRRHPWRVPAPAAPVEADRVLRRYRLATL